MRHDFQNIARLAIPYALPIVRRLLLAAKYAARNMLPETPGGRIGIRAAFPLTCTQAAGQTLLWIAQRGEAI